MTSEARANMLVTGIEIIDTSKEGVLKCQKK